MPRKPIPTWYFALVIVRKDDRFLLVQEANDEKEWYFPAGRVEPGETLEQGAIRETQEEAGIRVELDGIVRIQHTPGLLQGSRVRIIYLAHPVDDTPPKSEADDESLRANWFTLTEMTSLSLRGEEVLQLCQAVTAGVVVAPLSLVEREPGR